jgi:hypothetical protein
MKKLLLLLALATALSCSKDEPITYPECERVMAKGFDGTRCYLTLKSGRYVYARCEQYKLGDTYCN